MNYEYIVYGDVLSFKGPYLVKPPNKKPDN